MFAWAAVEMIVGKSTSGCESGAWVANVPEPLRQDANQFHNDWVSNKRRTYSFAQKLKSMTWLYGLTDATSIQIDSIKTDIREPMYHQAQFDEAALPVEETVKLASTLFGAVLKLHWPQQEPAA